MEYNTSIQGDSFLGHTHVTMTLLSTLDGLVIQFIIRVVVMGLGVRVAGLG